MKKHLSSLLVVLVVIFISSCGMDLVSSLSKKNSTFSYLLFKGLLNALNRNQLLVPRYSGPKLPIGMNLPSFSYYQPGTVFTDVMKSASVLHYYDASNQELMVDESIGKDANGYPTSIPQVVAGEGTVNYYRFYLNNYYPAGRYNVFFDGAGTLAGSVKSYSGQYYLDLTGDGVNTWIDVRSSTSGNHIRNIRILPDQYGATDPYPIFNKAYLEGLKPFHCLRFMDWFGTNGSRQIYWSDRITNTSYSQGRGMVAYEYAIELCNTLGVDAWVCVPHMASDDYIQQMAILWRDNLDTNLKIYLEYSNEIWNWSFLQTHWVSENGRYIDDGTGAETDLAVDAYVRTDLEALGSAGTNYPEKGAYMMTRVFNIWTNVFGADAGSRLVRVGTGQQAWAGNSSRILDYLFNTDPSHTGCDAFAVGAYMDLNEDVHNNFMRKGFLLNHSMMYDMMVDHYEADISGWTYSTADYVRNYEIDYLVYEGGQHMPPYQQNDAWPYVDLLYDFQITTYMYDLYSMNFLDLTSSEVSCKLFMAYDYIGPRKSRFGSWGHLERLEQIGTDYMTTAPKYQVVLDANAPR